MRLVTFLLFSTNLYQLMIPEDPKCSLNRSGTIRTSIPTICGLNCIEYYLSTCGSHSCHLGFKGKGKVYLSSRLNYHSKTVASFQLTRLALSGDVCPNPGPVSARNINKPKCNTCEKTVARNHSFCKMPELSTSIPHQMCRLNTEGLPSL